MAWHTAARPWQRGAWSIEVRGDEIADIAFEGRRVLRSVRAVVRDSGWATPDLVVDAIEEGPDGFELHVHTEGQDADLRGVVRVDADGDRLVVSMDLAAPDGFATNRTGLVVLHPHQAAGVDLHVGHTDGRQKRTRFPEAISPHQPVSDIATLAWTDDGMMISVNFAGDVFEMEDQRNWSDASFKTYSRPLALPFPYTITPGEHVRQTVTVEVSPAGDPDARAEPDRIVLTSGGPFPQLGLGAATGPDPAPATIPRVGDVRLVELDLATPSWPAALHRATATGRALDVRFILDPADPTVPVRAARALRDHDLARVGVFHRTGVARHVSDVEAVASLRRALAAADVRAPVVGGARSHFTELNRERWRLPSDLDGIVTATTPLFHATSTEQLVEAVAMQRLIAMQTVADAGGTPVHIGPVTLRPRFNDVATAPEPAPTGADLAEGYGAEHTGIDDVRQRVPELAAWTIASAAALAVPGVASLTFFEEWGPRGIHSSSGAAFPVAAAIDALAALAPGELQWGPSPDGLLWALGVRDADGHTRVLAANLGPADRALTIEVAGATIHAHIPADGWVAIDHSQPARGSTLASA
ncbi:hypothetical protein [Microbacterium invictum]|uniref:Uncharacterized protein n=1 Tax=Microbacterium invictum TaxID=515415 RepID=A0AA40VP26_9MICO|nr:MULTISPECIES: hypothetical protein [Microbacterium]MBB4141018.1 hypothetical protein [Microbacterium invictum]